MPAAPKSKPAPFQHPRSKSVRSRRSHGRIGAPSTANTSDIRIEFPTPDCISIVSDRLFKDARGALAYRFVERAFLAPEVREVEVNARAGKAFIRLADSDRSNLSIVRDISRRLATGQATARESEPLEFPPGFDERGADGFRLSRFGNRLSTWSIRHEIPGRIRLQNTQLFRRRAICQAIERELMNTAGIDRYSTNDFTSTVLIHFDTKEIQKHQTGQLDIQPVIATTQLQERSSTN